METCILLPEQLSVVSCVGKDVRNILEMDVTIWSNCYLPTGTCLPVDDGEIKYEKLEVFSKLKPDNIRHQFGCYDEIVTVEGCEVRHCNWVRFVKSSSKLEEVNAIGVKLKGEIVYQMVKDVKPNQEIVVYFQNLPETTTVQEEEMNVVHEEATVQDISSDVTDISSARQDSDAGISTSDDSGNFSDSQVGWRVSVQEENLPAKMSSPPDDIIPIKKSRGRTWLPCEICQKKFDRPSLLKRHMRTHTGEKPHSCEICGKAFSTSSSLNTHRRIHSGEKPHECNVCGKKFTASSNLYYHRMTHNKEKPHKCTVCSKSFPTPGDLRSHMYVHSGSWPFKCDLCNRGFSKETNLKNHLLLHKGEKAFQCEICDKKFTLLCNLKTHLKLHKGQTKTDTPTNRRMRDVTLSTTNNQLTPDFTTSRSPSDYSITRLTESSSKRRRLDANNIYSPGVYNKENHSSFPVFSSTPLNKIQPPFSFSPYMASPLFHH